MPPLRRATSKTGCIQRRYQANFAPESQAHVLQQVQPGANSDVIKDQRYQTPLNQAPSPSRKPRSTLHRHAASTSRSSRSKLLSSALGYRPTCVSALRGMDALLHHSAPDPELKLKLSNWRAVLYWSQVDPISPTITFCWIFSFSSQTSPPSSMAPSVAQAVRFNGHATSEPAAKRIKVVSNQP